MTEPGWLGAPSGRGLARHYQKGRMYDPSQLLSPEKYVKLFSKYHTASGYLG